MSATRQTARIDRKQRPRAKTPTIDRRAARTRHALHGALISLILRKGYEAISVQDICDEADIGRSTFYAHFSGKDELLRNGADWLRAMLVAHRERAAVEGAGAHPPLAFARVMFEHTREQRALYRAMVGGRAGTIILDMMRQVLAETVRADLAALHGVPAAKRELAVHYLVGGFMAVLTWWLDRGAKEPPEQMEAAFRALALHGLGGRRREGVAE